MTWLNSHSGSRTAPLQTHSVKYCFSPSSAPRPGWFLPMHSSHPPLLIFHIQSKPASSSHPLSYYRRASPIIFETSFLLRRAQIQKSAQNGNVSLCDPSQSADPGEHHSGQSNLKHSVVTTNFVITSLLVWFYYSSMYP